MKLGDFSIIKTGKGITQNDCDEMSAYPVISGGQTPMGYYRDYNREAYTITISRVGAYAGFVNFITKRFYLNDKCFSIELARDNSLISKYLFYYLKKAEPYIKSLQSEGGVPTINTIKISNILIPIPPLAEQERIVSILDRFEALTTDLASGLPAEIKARQQQYEYYRDSLLSFPRKSSNQSDI